MAQEFGGKFSPNKPTGASTAQVKAGKPKATFRARLMFLAPLPLLLTGFGQITAGNPIGIIRDFAAFAILILAAWLLTEGLKAEAAYQVKKSARKPAFPRKIFASALVGIGVAVASSDAANGGLLLALVLGGLAALLHLIAFGIDPLKNKGMGDFDGIADRRVALAVQEAEAHITAMLDAIAPLRDRHLQKRLDTFVASARSMARNVEEDPRDLTTARKYLGVYLMGAKDATLKFAALYEKTKDPAARADYEALLTDLETNFDAQRQELLLDDKSDLDVEIDVLRERLRHEGVAT